jgi:1-hydroxy-2-naphthoate dioxygenase
VSEPKMHLDDVKDIPSLKVWAIENNIRLGHLGGETVSTGPRDPQPYLWKRETVEAAMAKMIKVVSLEDAIRRNLGLLNPRNAKGVNANLGLGLQCVMPGEQAISHRHSAAAIRFVVKGTPNAFNLGDGEPMPFGEGDLITNPHLTFHGHVNHSDQPVMWLDGLDGTFARVGHEFREDYPGEEPVDTERVAYSNKTMGLVRPTWLKEPQQPPPFRYPWAETEAALTAMQQAETEPNPFDGHHVTYCHPLTGGPTLPTVACEISLLPAGFKGQSHRHNSTTCYHVFRGEAGTSIVDGERFEWEKGDFFVIPPWSDHRHENLTGTDAILFEFSDWPAMRALGLYETQETHAEKGLPARQR